jgi:hypothetical protein
MALEVHFEIYRRQGSKGGWLLHDVAVVREAALQLAQALMSEEKATGVKVVKETYNPDSGQYLSLKIYEDGHTKLNMHAAAEEAPHALPCFNPDDLYSYHARATIARVLHDHLARHKLTVTELIHRADALEKLEATGTIYQHAIQKIAIAQASATTSPVQHIIKSLNELTTKAVHRVYRDTRRNYFPFAKAGGFGGLAGRLAAADNGLYQLNGSLARHLAPAQSWDEKLRALLALVPEIPETGPGRTLLLGALDALIAEVLGSSAALHELIGETENLGAALLTLVELFLGQPRADGEDGSPLSVLTRHFADDVLPEARTAIANRITAELRSVRRLCPASLPDELKHLRRIANTLVTGEGKYLSQDDIIAAFTLRSRRIVANESIAEHLAEVQLADDKLDRLLLIEENIVGPENKRQLATFMLPIVTGAPFESRFLSPGLPVFARLKKLAALQTRIRRSGIPEQLRDDLSGHIDRIACEVETRTKLLRSVEEKCPHSVDAAVAILKLCASGVFTEGKLSEKARAMVMHHLSQPGFFTGYVSQFAHDSGQTNAEAAMNALMQTLVRAGIAPEAGLRSIAA